MRNKFAAVVTSLILILSIGTFSSCTLLFPDSNGTEQNGTENSRDDSTENENNNSNDKAPSLDLDKYIPITSGGEAKIKIISAYSKPTELKAAIDSLKGKFSEFGITFEEGYSTSNKADDYELLIGEGIGANTRYYVGAYHFGEEGYAIRVIDNKIIVNGGSTEKLIYALNEFKIKVLGIGAGADLKNISVPRNTDIFVRQYYPITSFTVADRSIADFKIVVNYTSDLRECATALQNAIYSQAGYWLDITTYSDKGGRVFISVVDDAGDDGFRMCVREGDLYFECEYPLLLVDTFIDFTNQMFMSDIERSIELQEGYMQSVHISTVRYSAYGAVGDGIADDFEAIKKTHEAANLTGQTVVADTGKTYSLGQHAESIKIKTDTVWTGATFIIDDSEVGAASAVRDTHVFSIVPDKQSYQIPLLTLEKGQGNIGITFETDVLIHVADHNVKQYIRYGENADSGAAQQEVILVHKDGTVDPSTPVMWDYATVTEATVYPVGDKPITITGGHFITVANAAPRQYTYYKRGIGITRSNLTMRDVVHTIEGEGDTGAPYAGFIDVSRANNLLFESMVFTGHKTYKLLNNDNNSMGTYEISSNNANNITWLNCTQTNDINDTAYWGVMGSNYCKNLVYDGCILSRFDAHKGTHNAIIRNSEVGHQKISIIGSGTLLIENTVVNGNSIVNLRSDYGSTWQGDVILKNITLNNTSTPTLISASWNNHYFGYTCYLPENITVDGLKLANGTSFYVLPNLSTYVDNESINGAENKNVYVLTKTVTIKNNTNEYTCAISKNMVLFADVTLIKE